MDAGDRDGRRGGRPRWEGSREWEDRGGEGTRWGGGCSGTTLGVEREKGGDERGMGGGWGERGERGGEGDD